MDERNDSIGKSANKKRRTSVSDDISRKIAERLFGLIEQRDETQAKVAKETGISRAAISSASSKGALSLPVAIALSRYFKVSLDYLCGLTDRVSPAEIALDYLESQIVLSSEQTEHGKTYFSAKISKPMADYLTALKTADLPEDIKDYYVSKTRKALIAAITKQVEQEAQTAQQTEQAEQDMEKYLILDFVGSATSGYLPPDFEQAIDEYLRQNKP